MKAKNKALLLSMCALLLVAASVFGTLAYLTDEQTVTNTFTVGNVKITLDEAKINAAGKPIDEADAVVTDLAKAVRVEANAYHLLPGHSYTKDPTVTVLKGSEQSYVRMLVTINCQEAIDDIDALDGQLNAIFTGYNSNWALKLETTAGDTRTYEFRYNTTVSAPSANLVLPALFTGIKVPNDITGDDLAKLANLEIKVVAQAIQADGFTDAADAWAAFSA